MDLIMVIATDFDGTLCESVWPGIGAPNTELIEVLKKRRAEGDKIILWTCREEDKLQEAIAWCKKQGLEFDAVNDNLQERKEHWGNNPRKIFADEYWDDKARIKCYVNWNPRKDIEEKFNKNIIEVFPDYSIKFAVEVLKDSLLEHGDLYKGFCASIRSAINDMPDGTRTEDMPEMIMRRIIGED